VLVGTEGTYKPFNFKDEDGNLTGYDIDVLKEVDRRIEDL
jgi:ABC-type amino acid transport substrate-binding protein